jgi:hypothetical protein
MRNPLEDKGRELWKSLPEHHRGRFAIRRFPPEAIPWIRIVIYLAFHRDEKAIKACQRLFVAKGGKFLPREGRSLAEVKHITTPVLLDSFIGVNGRQY